MSERRSFLSDMSWFQVLAGALAAMTSAWIASTLGVAGTIIGAALGSFVVAISSAFFSSTLDKGRTLIVQTDSGTRTQTAVEPGESDAEAVERVERTTGSRVRTSEFVEKVRQKIRWKVVAITTLVILVISGLAMGAYELVTGNAYGSDPDNARIGNPFGGHKAAGTPTDDSSQEPGGSNQQDDDGQGDPTPSATQPPTATTPAPTASSATPSPTATVSPQGDSAE